VSRHGRLTGDGFPFELTCTSLGRELRYTAEAAGPLVPPEQRLSVAAAILGRLGARGLEPGIAQQVRSFQTRGAGGSGLWFGAWISARHLADQDRFKIYIEVPGEARDAALALAGWKGSLAGLMPGAPVPELPMLGQEPGSGIWELYLRTTRLEAWRLGRLLGRAGLEGREPELRDMLERITGGRLDEALPGPGIGISYAIHRATSRIVAFSLFFVARSIAGSDRRIRRRILEVGAELSWRRELYDRLTRSLRKREDWRTRHGMIGLVLVQDEPLVAHVGLRPPEPGEDEP
jgi:hypothetical protein